MRRNLTEYNLIISGFGNFLKTPKKFAVLTCGRIIIMCFKTKYLRNKCSSKHALNYNKTDS